MLAYLKKYQELPKDLRDKMSNPAVVSAISELEKKYSIGLASSIMKIMIKEVAISDLSKYFMNDFKLEEVKALELEKELKEKVFFGVANYLNIDLILEGKERILSLNAQNVYEGTENKNVMFNVLPNNGDKPAVVDTSFFSKEDEEEIKNLSAKIKDKEKNILHENSVDEKLDKMIKETGVNFGSEELANRLKNILKTYIRRIRGRVDVKQTLMKPLIAGGLDIDIETAEKILKAVDAHIKDLGEFAMTSAGSRAVPPEKIKTPDIEKEKMQSLKNIGARDFDYDLKSLKGSQKSLNENTEGAEISGKELIGKLNKKPEIKKIAPLPPVIQKKDIKNKLNKKISSFFIPPTVKETVKEERKSVTEIRQIDARRMASDSGKIKMEDIKPVREKEFMPKVMGPVDELRYMDLTNFRRIDVDPGKAIEKIKDKIKLLEEESYTKRIEGIRAWRNSPVNKIYLEMGYESIGVGEQINGIIEKRKREGREFMKEEEFEAISILNNAIRF